MADDTTKTPNAAETATPNAAETATKKAPPKIAASSFDLIEKYEKEYGEKPPKPRMRLPRVGCIWLFVLMTVIAVIFATFYYHSCGEIAPDFDIPEGRVTLSDMEGVLLDDDKQMMEALATDIAKSADCSVALMFVHARCAGLPAIYEQMAGEWAPGKGVLMVCDVHENSMQFGLLGSGWRLAGWDEDAAWKECSEYHATQRGLRAIALLTRLKSAIEAASKIPVAAPADDTSAPAAEKNRANLTEEEIEKAIDAEERALRAELDAEEGTAEGGSRTGEGILYATGMSRDGDGSVRSTAITFVAILAAIAFIFLKHGKSKRASLLKKNPEVIEEFRKKWPEKKYLSLTDLNAPSDGWTHKGFLRGIALILGLAVGLGFVSSTVTEEPARDVARTLNSSIPEYPENQVLDAAEVFGADGTARVIAAIERLEEQTGGEMIVYTLPTIGLNTSIEEFGLDVATKWKIGKKGVDNGALFVLAIDDHLSRLEIGYGWEGPVNDARAGDLLRMIRPDLQAERYADAAIKVVQGIETFVTGVRPGEVGAAEAKPQETFVPEVKTYPALTPARPANDPRVLNPDNTMWGIIGLVGMFAGLLLAYWGKVVGTSVPHLFIHDPTRVPVSTGSSGSSSGSRSRSSSSSRSYHSSSSSRRSGGGGSFGGGGASGRW
ncbi:MAG: TPM domain-containing protein [Lentisphaeria bacterium]|nr:TPM domain-containing protein [Lentisphaeria bacterium]